MMQQSLFKTAWPYQDNILALPVGDIDKASEWYCRHFGMTEVKRLNNSLPTVILKRDGVEIGFSVNGRDATQDGAGILVTNIHQAHEELESNGVKPTELKIEERDGEKYHVFFVVAPDGLCYYFHQLLSDNIIVR